MSIDVLVDAVLRVCAQLGVSRAHFAGHSMGTIVCQHLAVRAPERVRSLALFGALLAPPDGARQGLRTRAAKARDEGMFGIADAIVQGALSSSTREQLPVVVAFVRESLLAQDPEGYARTCEALAAAEPAAIDAIDVPTLLVAGDEDAIAPVQVAREMARRIGDAQVEVLSRCGHWMTAERADRMSVASAHDSWSARWRPERRRRNMANSLFTNVRIFDGSGDQPYCRRSAGARQSHRRASRARQAACVRCPRRQLQERR